MMLIFIGLEKQILVMVRKVHMRTQFMSYKTVLRIWRMKYYDQMQRGGSNGCIGVADEKEYQVFKYLDPVKERRSLSEKNYSYKLFSVMDHSRCCIFSQICLGKNDHDVFTSSPLYLQEGEFFSDDEFVAADGTFEVDGHLWCSFKNPGNDKVKRLWNLAFCEVRMGMDNSSQRRGA